MITWLEVLPCGCCGIIWALLQLRDGTALLSVLTELEPDEPAGCPPADAA